MLENKDAWQAVEIVKNHYPTLLSAFNMFCDHIKYIGDNIRGNPFEIDIISQDCQQIKFCNRRFIVKFKITVSDDYSVLGNIVFSEAIEENKEKVHQVITYDRTYFTKIVDPTTPDTHLRIGDAVPDFVIFNNMLLDAFKA